MNLAVRGIDADIQWNNACSFHKDALKDLKADYIWPIRRSISPIGAATAARGRPLEIRRPARRQRQLRLAATHPAPPGSDRQWRAVLGHWFRCPRRKAAGDIRRAMVEGDVVDCMIAWPSSFRLNLIPACLVVPGPRQEE